MAKLFPHSTRTRAPGILVMLAGLLFICCLLAGALAADLRCDYCRKRVVGKYYQAGDKVACADCYKRYDNCAACNMPVTSGTHRHQGEKVCSECAGKAGVCGSCGDVLIGKHYIARYDPLTKGFCETCYKTKPRCIVCDLPYKRMHSSRNGPICPTCMVQLDQCVACGEAITGSYFTVEHVKGKFCKHCFEEQPHCDFCGRPIANGGNVLPDHRHACAECSAQAVQKTSDVLLMLAELAEFCREEWDIPYPRPFDLVMVDNNQMAIVAKKKRRSDTPATRESSSRLRELGFFDSNLTPQSPRATLTILSNLPRTACMETLAHEYAHLWQFSVNPALKDPKVIEGFAQWMAGKWLLEKKEFSAYAKLAARRDPVYGEGFHAMLQIEKRLGVEGVLDHVRNYQREKSARAYPAKSPTLEPLSKILPKSLLDGSYAFLKNAVVVTPDVLTTELRKAP